MASTRNRNTLGNYELEQNNMAELRKHKMYAGHLFHEQTCYAGDGLLPGRYPLQLFNDNCDVESELLGIGSTNLVTPKTTTMLPPAPRPLPTGSIIERRPDAILPTPLVISGRERYHS
jgi:hypothetical protein